MQSEFPREDYFLAKGSDGKDWKLYRIGMDIVGGVESPCDVSIPEIFATKEEALIYCDACGIKLTAVG